MWYTYCGVVEATAHFFVARWHRDKVEKRCLPENTRRIPRVTARGNGRGTRGGGGNRGAGGGGGGKSHAAGVGLLSTQQVKINSRSCVVCMWLQLPRGGGGRGSRTDTAVDYLVQKRKKGNGRSCGKAPGRLIHFLLPEF